MSELKLKQVCHIKGGSGFPEVFQGKQSGDFPVVKVSDMELPGNHRYIYRANNYLDSELAKRLRFTIFPKNAVVFAKVGAALLLNRRRILAQETILDNNMMGLTPTAVESEFLYHFLTNVDFGFLVQTGALPSINQEIVGEIEIPNFPLPHQRKIARILTTVDNLIEKTEALIAKYQAIKQGMMHDLFTRGVDEHGHLRPPYEEAPELYKQSELGWIPKEWTVNTTSEVSVKIWIGLVTTMTKHYVSSGVKLIRNQNIKENYVSQCGIINLSDSFASLYENRKLRLGDVVTVHTGDVGTSAVIDSTLDGSHGFATINTRVKDGLVSNTFLCHFYNSQRFKRQVASVVTGDGRDNLNMKDFVKLLVPYPKDKTEQGIICLRIAASEHAIAAQCCHLAKLGILKTGLMQDLLTGKVRVKVDEAEETGHV